MLITAHAQNLAGYFHQSGRFYYFLTDLQGYYTYVNPLFQKQFSHITADFYGTEAADTFTNADKYKLALQQCLQNPGITVHIELNIKLEDGSLSVTQWELSLCPGDKNISECIQAIGFSVNEMAGSVNVSKEITEDQLRRQAAILDNVSDLIMTTDFNLTILSWNKKAEEVVGYSAEEVIGKFMGDVVRPDYGHQTPKETAAELNEKGFWQGELSFVNKYGIKKYILHTSSYLLNAAGERIAIIGTGKDITERKKAEEQLQKSELFYRNLIAHSLDGVLVTDENGKIRFASPSITEILGYDIDDVVGKTTFDFAHPEDQMVAVSAFQNELADDPQISFIRVRLQKKTGEWTWCIIRGHNLMQNPYVNGMMVYFYDDTLRKETEDRLRESEQRFRDLIYNLKQGVILQNENEEMIVCNQAALDMLGITEDQLLKKKPFDPCWNVIYENGSDFPGEAHPIPLAIQIKKPVRDVVMGVYRPVTNDRVWLLVNAEPVLDNDNKIINVICSFTDITEQKRLSQELIEQEIQKQKQLTQATIDGQEKERQEIGKELHDNINQHLTITRLYLEVAREKAAGEILEMINLSHKNLAGAINEIRQMSQSLVPPTLGDLGLIESVLDLCDSLQRAHTFNIDFLYKHFQEDQLADNLKLMFFRIIQEQVNNIIRHAAASNIHIRLQSDAEYMILTIEDDGKGFDPANYKKGQGFSNISNRAGLFNGKVEINAAPGKGCAITVIVPQETT
jgi:PAS domain S-box-containing protein